MATKWMTTAPVVPRLARQQYEAGMRQERDRYHARLRFLGHTRCNAYQPKRRYLRPACIYSHCRTYPCVLLDHGCAGLLQRQRVAHVHGGVEADDALDCARTTGRARCISQSTVYQSILTFRQLVQVAATMPSTLPSPLPHRRTFSFTLPAPPSTSPPCPPLSHPC